MRRWVHWLIGSAVRRGWVNECGLQKKEEKRHGVVAGALPGRLSLARTGVHGSVSPLHALPGLGPNWGRFNPNDVSRCSAFGDCGGRTLVRDRLAAGRDECACCEGSSRVREETQPMGNRPKTEEPQPQPQLLSGLHTGVLRRGGALHATVPRAPGTRCWLS